jgi:hypothetical protein
MDWPERVIGIGKWVRLFRAAGFLSIPYGLSRPDSAMTVFRGATAERRAGMSWTTDIGRADQFRQRHSWHAPTAIYRVVAAPDAVLALLERRGEGPPEILEEVARLGARLPGSIHHGSQIADVAGPIVAEGGFDPRREWQAPGGNPESPADCCCRCGDGRPQPALDRRL